MRVALTLHLPLVGDIERGLFAATTILYTTLPTVPPPVHLPNTLRIQTIDVDAIEDGHNENSAQRAVHP